MNIGKQIKSGVFSHGTAVLLIFRSQMWMAFVVPLFLQLGLLWLGEFMADHLAKADFAAISDDNASQYLILGVESIAVYLGVYMNKYMVLALLAPVLTALSTKTEFLLTGNTYKYSVNQYFIDVRRALTISFRNMGLLMAWMAVIYILSFFFRFPTLVHDIAYYALAFYFYGFSFLDYAGERRRLTVAESVAFTRKHAVAAYIIGAVYGSLFKIPYAGVIVAPILGAVAGTIVVHDLVDLRTNPYAIRKDEPQASSEETQTVVVESEENTDAG